MSSDPVNIQFLDAIRAAGIDYPGPVIADGALHRFKANGDRGPNGWYLLHGDGIPAGAFGHWKQGINATWCAKDNTELTDTERAERDRRFADILAEREADRRRQHDAASHDATSILAAAHDATDDHPYLVRKQVRAYPGVKCGDWPQRRRANCLLIPLRDASSKLVSIEAIYPEPPNGERNKDFLKNSQKSGAFFGIGDPAASDTLLLAEGYATAATLHEATGYTAVMAADAGNLKAVASALRVLYRDKAIIVCADNDRLTEGNPGLTKATAAAKAIKGLLAVPQFADDEVGSDFNDLALLHSLDNVCDCITTARKPTAQAFDVAAESAPAAESDADKPTIDAIPGDLHIVIRKAEHAILSADTPIFQRSGQLVRPATLPVEVQLDGTTLPAGSLVIEPVNKAWLAERMNVVANWRKYNERKGMMVSTDCPVRYAEHYLAKKGEWNTRLLTGIVEAPTLRRDGSLLTQAGYDAQSGLYLNYTGHPVTVPTNPTRADALKALDALKEPFDEFPFVGAVDLSVALSGLLTAVIRRPLRTAPFHAIDAPTPGTGKGLVVDVSAIIATGRPATAINQGANPAEDEKRIGALLMKGVSVISLDNVERHFEGEFLCSLATQETVDHRVLGTSTTVTLPSNTATVFITGNNLVFKGDITRRVLLCRIDPQCERPDAREFNRDLHQFVADNRHQLLSAALTVLRAYICEGSPPHGKAPYGSFTQWDGRVRGALLWLGQPDPLESRERIVSNDPVITGLRSLLASWFEAFSDRSVTAHEVIGAATPRNGDGSYPNQKGEELRHVLLEIAATQDGTSINPRVFGRYLSKHRDKVAGGYRLEQVGISHQVALWRVKPTGSGEFKGGFGGFGGFVQPKAWNFAEENEDNERKKSNAKKAAMDGRNPPNPLNPPSPLGNPPRADGPPRQDGVPTGEQIDIEDAIIVQTASDEANGYHHKPADTPPADDDDEVVI